MKINYEKQDSKIYGTGLPRYSVTCKEFPLEVFIIAAPMDPHKIIAANYKSCIEGRMVLPEEISSEDALDTAKWVLKGGHTPSLESIHISFGIKNASVVLLKQISRHRIGNSLGVMTQRANSEEWLGKIYDNNHFVVPPSFDHEAEKRYASVMKSAQDFYNWAIEEGIQQDEARYAIPQGATTLWQGVYAYQTLKVSICSTRMCHVMQGEMVALSHLMAKAVSLYNDELGYWLRPTCIHSGICNRNENNPTKEHPKGVCEFTMNGLVPVREVDNTFDLTQYSKDATK